jgi:pimeloyl-ACP methyl ester carboxylesterase
MFVCSRTISIPAEKATLTGRLSLPRQAKGLVVFAPERGSSRLDERSRYLTHLLQEADFGTLCVDLLTPAETRSCPPGDCAELLMRRLVAVGRWVQRQPELQGHPLGFFAEGATAAAVLAAATELGAPVGAVVACGSGHDLTWQVLPQVHTPTLLLVGEQDQPSSQSEWPRPAHRIPSERRAVPGAGRRFQEPVALAQAVTAAAGWFGRYMRYPSLGY